jgi:vancomycin resistance protein YoaR
MNKGVGPRIAAKGYQEAHVIVKGELTTGMAGGICQATTTVYNAALLANFQIVQRTGHGLKVGYVNAGRDATISGDYIDFKFRNTNKNPIFIHTLVRNGKVTVSIFGANEHPGQTVDIISTILQKISPAKPEYIKDPTMYIGTEKVESKAIQGMKSIAYRKVYQNGKLIKDELLSKDKYQAARAKILIGTKPLDG